MLPRTNSPFDILQEAESLVNQNLSLDSMPFASINMDITEDEDEYIVTADLPGYAEEEISVTIKRNSILRIEAESNSETVEDEDQEYHLQERQRQHEVREVRLPTKIVNPDSVETTYSNGVLSLRIPKQTESQDNTVEINIE